MKNESIEGLVHEFVSRLGNIVCTQIERAGKFVERGAVAQRRAVSRKKPPVQLCPVPKCNNRAAPVFGMVCRDHKNVPKAKLRKYRELRRQAAAAAQ